MRSFDPQTLLLLETAFDEAWLTLKSFGNNTVKPDELARAVFRLAMEDERHPVRLHDGALERLLPATTLARGELIAQQCRASARLAPGCRYEFQILSAASPTAVL